MAGFSSGSQGGLSLTSLDRSLSTGPFRQRIAPIDANSFHIVAQGEADQVLAHRFIREAGGTDPLDAGPPYQPWRYSGTCELPSFDASPVGDAIFVYSDDLGAQDYALQFAGSEVFGGSYHGGETLSSSAVMVDGVPVDPTRAIAGSQISIRYSSQIDAAGNTARIEFSVTVRSFDGVLVFHCAGLQPAATLWRAYVGMVIASGAYDEAHLMLTSSETVIPVPVAVGTTYLGNVATMRMKQTSDGRYIDVMSNIAGSQDFDRAMVIRTAQRTKLYFELADGGGSNKVDLQWTVRFGQESAGSAAVGANVLSNGSFDTDLAGWTVKMGEVVSDSGVARLIGNPSTQTRVIQEVSTPSVDGSRGVYLLSADANTDQGATRIGGLGLTSNSNGSTSTPPPAYGPVLQKPGYTGHLILPTQDLSYVMMQLGAGPSGESCIFDNVSLIKLTDSL